MSAPLRWLTVLLLLACLALTSEIVTCLNSEAGSWATLLVLCTFPLALASLRQAGQREFMVTLGVTLSVASLYYAVNSNAQWQLTIAVERAEGTMVFEDDQRYVTHPTVAARVPFHGINDAWAILAADDTPCTITWWNGTDREVLKAPLKAFFAKRSLTRPGDALLVLLVLFLNTIPLVTWARTFTRGLPPAADLLRSRAGLALTFLTGLVVASVISPPSTWLSNEFLSRPDDWLCYETGARAMLTGNWALMPPPGSVEVWSLLYTPVVAVLHGLLGPSTRPIYVVQFAAMLLLVPLFIRLIGPGQRRLIIITAIAVLVFVLADINLHYSWHLLSDLLPLLLLVVLFIGLKENWDARVIALLCGLLYLARLELIGAGPLVLLFSWKKWSSTPRDRLRFAGIWLLCIAPYFIRWALLYGNVRPFPVAMEDTGHVPWDMMLTAEHMLLKLRALFGDYSAINPDLRTRYHWLIFHMLFVRALAIALVRCRADRLAWSALVLFGYVLLTRVFSPSVGIYGHRHSLALVLLEGLFIVLVSAGLWRRATFGAQPRDPILARSERLDGSEPTGQVHSSRT